MRIRSFRNGGKKKTLKYLFFDGSRRARKSYWKKIGIRSAHARGDGRCFAGVVLAPQHPGGSLRHRKEGAPGGQAGQTWPRQKHLPGGKKKAGCYHFPTGRDLRSRQEPCREREEISISRRALPEELPNAPSSPSCSPRRGRRDLGLFSSRNPAGARVSKQTNPPPQTEPASRVFYFPRC